MSDIRTSAGRASIADIYRSRPDSSLSKDQVAQGLESLARHLGGRDWFGFEHGVFLVPHGQSSQGALQIAEAVELGLRLQRLSKWQGFEVMLAGFNNRTQVLDTLFETEVADYLAKRPQVSTIRFGPEYVVKGRARHPDFEVETINGLVVCECKNMHSYGRTEHDAFQRLHSIVAAAVDNLGGVPNNFRIECHFTGPVVGNRETFARELVGQALERCVAEGGEFVFGPETVAVRRRGSPLKFPGAKAFHMRLQNVRVGVVFKVDRTESDLCCSTDRTMVARSRAAGELLRNAKDQLPSHHLGAVFLRSILSLDDEVFLERLAVAEYAHCWFFCKWSDEGIGGAFARQRDLGVVGELLGADRGS